jgi:hypothetical protein
MSHELITDEGMSFRCPACRARQPLQDECRRCAADLSLVVRAWRRVEFLLAAQALAVRHGDLRRQSDILAELRLLRPSADR